MADITDATIEALVRAREAGMTRDAAAALVHDVFEAPWDEGRKEAAAWNSHRARQRAPYRFPTADAS